MINNITSPVTLKVKPWSGHHKTIKSWPTRVIIYWPTINNNYQCWLKILVCVNDTTISREKLTRIEMSSICRQQFANILLCSLCRTPIWVSQYKLANICLSCEGHSSHTICNSTCQWNWRGVWKKALSDVWLTTRFSFQIALYLLVKQKENLTLHQVSLRPFFCAPLQL